MSPSTGSRKKLHKIPLHSTKANTTPNANDINKNDESHKTNDTPNQPKTSEHDVETSFYLEPIFPDTSNINTYQDNLIQTSLLPVKDNQPFGNLITVPKQEGCTRVYFQNINGIFKFKTWDFLKQSSKKHLLER
jgi:hypothetical protein